jgi:hypothetical protein
MQVDPNFWGLDQSCNTYVDITSVRLTAQLLRASRSIYLETRHVLYGSNTFTYSWFPDEATPAPMLHRAKRFEDMVGAESFSMIHHLATNCLEHLHRQEVSEHISSFPALRSLKLVWTSHGGLFREYLPFNDDARIMVMKLPVHLARDELLKRIKSARVKTVMPLGEFGLDGAVSLWQDGLPTVSVVISFGWLSWESLHQFEPEWIRVSTDGKRFICVLITCRKSNSLSRS